MSTQTLIEGARTTDGTTHYAVVDSAGSLKVNNGAPTAAISITETLQTAQAGNANGTAIDITGYEAMTVMVNGTFTGAVNFEASIDSGTTWVAITMHASSQITAGTLATAQTNGIGATLWNLPSDRSAYNQFRARTSGMVAGSVTVSTRKYPV